MKDFSDRVVVITGSSEGIGLSTAYLMAEAGASVVINGRDSLKLEKACEKIKLIKGAHVLALKGDITDQEFARELIGKSIEKFNKIDILVNNVGGGNVNHNIENISDDEWQQSLDLNITSTFRLCRHVIPYMKIKNYGRIVNISSLAGRLFSPLSGPPYSASKAGMLGLTRHLASQLAKYGITVNAVAPGIVATERVMSKWDLNSKEEKARLMQRIPINRFARSEEIAHAILFLASSGASYITGITIDVNGGFYMS